jgi:hypothetical protein
MSEYTADVNEFTQRRNKLPAKRVDILSVGKYILELYVHGLANPAVIEVNEKVSNTDNKKYAKVTSLRIDDKEQAEATFDSVKTEDDVNKIM